MLPTGTGEQTGLSFTIKLPNIEVLERNTTDGQAQTSLTISAAHVKLLPADTSHSTDTQSTEKCGSPVQDCSTTVTDCGSPVPDCSTSVTDCSTPVTDYTADCSGTDCPSVTDDTFGSVEEDLAANIHTQMQITEHIRMAPKRNLHIGKLREDNDNSYSSCDSLYYDASDDAHIVGPAGSMEDNRIHNDVNEDTSQNVHASNEVTAHNVSADMAHLTDSHSFRNSSNEPPNDTATDSTNQSCDAKLSQDALLAPPVNLSQNATDSSDDSGYEMAEEAPHFFFHDARIRCFVFGEHRIFELYVDGSMIQEHTKDIISCEQPKNDVAKKKD